MGDSVAIVVLVVCHVGHSDIIVTDLGIEVGGCEVLLHQTDHTWRGLSPCSLRIRIFTVGADIHIVVILLLQGRPPLLPDQRIYVLVLGIVLEEGLGGRRLGLVMVRANVTAYVLRLVEIIVSHSLLHRFPHAHHWAHYYAGTARLVCIIEHVGVGHILSVDAATPFDHGQLLAVQVLVRV